MTSGIIDRGRGPELAGTRVTVYRLFDFVDDDARPDQIAEELGLSEEQVRIGLEYIAAHRHEVEAEYAKILQRVQQDNPDWIEAGTAPTPDALRERIRGRGRRTLTHAHPGR